MKNKNRFLVILSVFIILCASATALTGCKQSDGGNKNPTPPAPEVENTLVLTRNVVRLVYGESAVVVAKYKDEDGVTLEWKSSDEAVATVEGGVITSVGIGNATITATYGELKADCSVSVSFGDYQPTLKVDRIGDELSLLKGDVYDVSASVAFNGKTYDCGITVEIANEEIASFENGKIKAIKSGTTEVTVTGEWNNFDTPLMQKTFLLKVTDKDVTMYMAVDKGGEEEVADEITLSVTDSFEGKNYINEATVKFVVKENGVEKRGTLSLTSGSNVIDFVDGVITSKGLGTATITADYTDESGKSYQKTLTVTVTCPVAIYKGHVEWTDATLKNVLSYFDGATAVLYAKQGAKELQHTKKMLTGVVFNGDMTEPIEVQTDKGGYIFEDIYGSNAVLTNDNFATELTLGSAIKNKYYSLGGDIGAANSPIDMAGQKNATDSANFAGTFDGRGHTVYAATDDNGIFGGYGYNAVIKNAEFIITFKTATATGITSDKGRWAKSPKMNATIENVHIVTTNFGEKNHVISNLKVELLKMKDVLVEVNGAENLADFDGRDDVGVLFGIDISYYALMMANAGLEGFDNVRVVVNKFLPMANGANWSGSKFLNFALNDESEFGKITRASENRDSVEYSIAVGVEKHSDWLRDVHYTVDKTQPDGYKHVNCIAFYHALPKIEKGGVYRYDTIDALKKAGVTQVGDWIVE